MPSLRTYQLDAIKRLRESIAQGHRRVILQAPTGCHAPGTEILMGDGTIKKVEDIRIGDTVTGLDSQRSVIELHRGTGEMFLIRPIKGSPFAVNGGHILTMIGTVTGKITDISVNDYLKTSKSWKHLQKLFRIPVEFNSGANVHKIDPYFLGVLLGDGTIRGSVAVSKDDPEIVDLVQAEATRWGLSIRKCVRRPGSVTYYLTNGRSQKTKNGLISALKEIGLWGIGGGDKFVPREYLTSSRENRFRILAGLVDTDGHYGSGYDWISKSQQLAKDVCFLARSLGLAAYLRPCFKYCQTGGGGKYYRVSISGDIHKIPCRIKRKIAAVRKQKKNALRTGFVVEPAGVGEYFGFTLAGDPHYLMGDFTVTHNSGKTLCAAEIIRRCIEKGKRVLFLAHRREIIRQSQNKLQDAGMSPGIIMAGEDREYDAPVQVASVQTLWARAFRKTKMDLPAADLLIIDEAHISASATYQKIIAAYPHAVIVGLTATPCRSDLRGLGDTYTSMTKTASIRELTEMGFLVPVRYFAPTVPDLLGIRMTAGDYNKKQLEERMDKVNLVGDVVENWARIAGNRLTVVFASGVKHSIHLRDAFRSAGVAAEHIDGDTPKDERDLILERLAAHEIQVVTNCAVLQEGWDMPVVSCCVLARPTKSVGLFLQMAGRILRPSPGKQDACIADGELVLTDRGLVPIQEINYSHRLWDGDSWVQHGGVIFKGNRGVIEYAGLTATPDHKVRTRMGWKAFGECAAKRIPIVTTALGGNEIREGENYFTSGSLHRGMEDADSNGGVPGVLFSEMGFLRESQEGECPWLQKLLSAETIPDLVLCQIPGSSIKMPEQKESILEKLRWARHKIQFQISDGGRSLGESKSWNTAKASKIGPPGQRRALRAGESGLGQPQGELLAYDPGESFPHEQGRIQTEIPACQIRRFHAVKVSNYHESRGSSGQVGPSFVQAKRKVWDILNAGPKNRFTVSGLLVHNCVIDHSGAIYEHGRIDEYNDWILTKGKEMQQRAQAKKKAEKRKEITCVKCAFMYFGRRDCPNCGFAPETFGKGVEYKDGYLYEIGVGEVESKTTKQDWYRQLAGYARERGYADGWISYKYRARFGVWPRGMPNEPVEPGPEVLAFIQKETRKWHLMKRLKEAKTGINFFGPDGAPEAGQAAI